MKFKKNLNPVSYCSEGDRTVVSGVDDRPPSAKQMECVRLSILVRIRGSDVVGIQTDLPASIALHIISHVESQVSVLQRR